MQLDTWSKQTQFKPNQTQFKKSQNECKLIYNKGLQKKMISQSEKTNPISLKAQNKRKRFFTKGL
jgi:hypothetical protein